MRVPLWNVAAGLALMRNGNNFDLVRLAAALQVAVTHALPHFVPGSKTWPAMRFIELFPGVPVFFFVSGFLISKSFENNPRITEYLRNRALRIYPALGVCFLISLAAVVCTGYFRSVHPPAVQLLLWTAGQLTIVQFFNPDFMRHYGTGVLNGSVWTITVELQFYVLVPLLYQAFRLLGGGARRSNAMLAVLICLFLSLQLLYVSASHGRGRELWFRLAGVSFAPWFYMFLVGIWFQRNSTRVLPWSSGRVLPLFLGYCALAATASELLGWNIGNTLAPPLFLTLAVLVFAAAHTQPQLSDRWLRRNDISYGVYIYHMPVVNLLLVLGLEASTQGLLLAFAGTLGCALLSWFGVEKPTLRLKRHPLYAHQAPAAEG